MAVVAILCSDLHLQHNPPACRAGEPNWYKAMQRVLDELNELQQEHNCPVIIAGDIFDKWDSPPQLISFAIKHLPNRTFTIPGQHDLPNHRYEDIGKSAYYTLELAHAINHIDGWHNENGLCLWPFAWGHKLQKLGNPSYELLHVAVVHSYVWIPGHEFYGAPKEQHLSSLGRGLEGYDVVLFGDNHSHFSVTCGSTLVWNNGTMMRRRSDEVECKPVVGLLNEDGTIKRHYLDISKDVFDPVPKKEKMDFDFSGVLKELDRLQDVKGSLDFMEVVRLALNVRKAPHAVRKIVLESMQDE